jgi:dTDP-4-dehydrorhamnose 3,5-epimerase-like enzyme
MYIEPHIIKGNSFSDERGNIIFNNDFNVVEVKRIYFIENHSIDFIRGWQGHQIEQRWFMCVKGAFEIKVIKIDNWENPSKDLQAFVYQINSTNSDVLHVPKGHITSIKAIEDESKLMAMSDYLLGDIKDEYRLDNNYFK